MSKLEPSFRQPSLGVSEHFASNDPSSWILISTHFSHSCLPHSGTKAAEIMSEVSDAKAETH
jgi:hypothetical protein